MRELDAFSDAVVIEIAEPESNAVTPDSDGANYIPPLIRSQLLL